MWANTKTPKIKQTTSLFEWVCCFVVNSAKQSHELLTLHHISMPDSGCLHKGTLEVKLKTTPTSKLTASYVGTVSPLGWQNEQEFYTVIQKIIDYLPVVCFELPLIIIIFFYPLQGHTFNFTVFCTLWTVVFNFFKESTLSFYYS